MSRTGAAFQTQKGVHYPENRENFSSLYMLVDCAVKQLENLQAAEP